MAAFYGILLPFLGTILGAGCVFFLKRSLGVPVQRALTGLCRRGHGGSVYLESADSGYGTGGGYGQRCGDSCRSRFLGWHPVPADFG